jgi:hypothetical protein
MVAWRRAGCLRHSAAMEESREFMILWRLGVHPRWLEVGFRLLMLAGSNSRASLVLHVKLS